MTTLPSTLQINGFIYSQVLREEKKAIYRQTVTPEIDYFEVFIILIRPERTFEDKLIHSKEKFPSNEDFGVYAWTYKTLEKAMEKFNALPKIKESQSLHSTSSLTKIKDTNNKVVADVKSISKKCNQIVLKAYRVIRTSTFKVSSVSYFNFVSNV